MEHIGHAAFRVLAKARKAAIARKELEIGQDVLHRPPSCPERGAPTLGRVALVLSSSVWEELQTDEFC